MSNNYYETLLLLFSPYPLRMIGTSFLLTMTPQLKHKGHENKGNDNQIQKTLIVEQILLISTLRNVSRTV